MMQANEVFDTAVVLVSRLSGDASPTMPVLDRPMISYVLDRLADAAISRCLIVYDARDKGALPLTELQALTAAEARFDAGLMELTETQPLVDALRRPAPDTDRPVLLTTADTLWLDGPTPALMRMAEEWKRKTPDALFLMVASVRAHLTERRGEARVSPDGWLIHPDPGYVPPYYFGRVALVRPERLGPDGSTASTFEGLARPWIGDERGGALVHDGLWFCLADSAGREDAHLELGEGRIRWVLQ